MNNKFMEEAYRLAYKAFKKNEVPVGAVIVRDNNIIAKSYNKRVKNNLVISHAEINSIIKASRKLKDWRLNDCDLYVTLKPCNMCMAIIKESRINKVYYLLDRPDDKKDYYKTTAEQMYANENRMMEKYKNMLNIFFENKR